MSTNSAIEWTDATWNPITGCTKISPGCKFCYAERLTERFGRQSFSTIVLHPERLELPLSWRTPRRIFVNSMSDLFHDHVPDQFIVQIFKVMAKASRHTFQVLTKRSDRMLAWYRAGGRIPRHVWVGVSVESAAYSWRVDRLRLVDAEIRFMSAEPLLGSLAGLNLAGIAWVITGGESGGSAKRALVHMVDGRLVPKADALRWVREIRDACRDADVAFFHKQWGGRTPKSGGRMLDGKMWAEYPRGARAPETQADIEL